MGIRVFLRWIALTLVVFAFALVLSTCGGGGGKKIVLPPPGGNGNHAPVVNSLSVPSSVAAGSSVSVSCNATDPDGDSLTYSWSATRGNFSGSGSSVTYHAPEVAGGEPQTAKLSVGEEGSLFNLGFGSESAVGQTFTSPFTGSITSIRVRVGWWDLQVPAYVPFFLTDASFTEIFSDGPLEITTGQQLYEIPLQPWVSVLEGQQYGFVLDGTGVDLPRAFSVGYRPDEYAEGSLYTISTSDEDWQLVQGDAVFEVLYQLDGGGGPEEATISVTVSDGRGGADSASRSITLTAGPPPGENDPPVIDSMSVPSSVPSGGSIGVSCTAHDPNGDSLTYSWSATQGSFSGTGSSVTYNAPTVSTDTSVTISVTVSDGELSDSASRNITVGAPATDTIIDTTDTQGEVDFYSEGLQEEVTVRVTSESTGDPLPGIETRFIAKQGKYLIVALDPTGDYLPAYKTNVYKQGSEANRETSGLFGIAMGAFSIYQGLRELITDPPDLSFFVGEDGLITFTATGDIDDIFAFYDTFAGGFGVGVGLATIWDPLQTDAIVYAFLDTAIESGLKQSLLDRYGDGDYEIVVYVDPDGDRKIWTEIRALGTGGEAPDIISVSPLSGTEGEEVTFTANVTGSAPFTYSWNFGGGASPNTSSQSGPTVTLGSVGEYSAYLTVTNDYGEDAKDFTLVVEPSGSEWHRFTVDDAGGQTGRYTSLAVVSGNPAISYADLWSGDDDSSYLKYVRATNAKGTSWGTPITIDSAAYLIGDTSLQLVNGNPAVSYSSLGDHADLKYVRASNANGTSWDAPVMVDSVASCSGGSLAVVNGRPAISYYDWDGHLKYVRANDASGTSWGSPVTVDVITGQPAHDPGPTCLAIVGGRPAISYYDWGNGDLKYVRANDASGNSWGSAITLDSAGDVGRFTSLAIVNGSPAVSYLDSTNYDLKYIRATDASGSSWGTPVTAAGGPGSPGFYNSLTVVNGYPAISYFNAACGYNGLYYVRAGDANGTIWGTPVIVDTELNPGQYSSLAVVNGNPAISYNRYYESALKFAIYY